MKLVKKQMKSLISLGILVLGLSWCFPLLSLATEASDVSDYITEMSVNGMTWYYGDKPVSVSVADGENVHVQVVLFYTKSQWREHWDGADAVLAYTAPAGVRMNDRGSSVVSMIDGEETVIGRLSVSSSDMLVTIDAPYAQMMAANDNIEIRMEFSMEFETGSYDLGDQFIVTATDSGSSGARWNNYMITLNKIDELIDSLLLDGAHFAIDIASYDESESKFQEYEPLAVTEGTFEPNETFMVEDNCVVTVGKQKTMLKGEFSPGLLYRLREVEAPIGYLPSDEPVQFAFFHYTDSEKVGTQKKVRELNKEYSGRYARAEGNVVTFGEEGGLSVSAGNIYFRNKKVPNLQILKKDAETGNAMPDVLFTLQADPDQMDYSVEQYLAIEDAGWQYNEEKGILFWQMETDDDGSIIFPEGTIPYTTEGMYSLVETVPSGYAGYGRDLSIVFRLTPEGQIVMRDESPDVQYMDNTIQLTVKNYKAVQLEISKVNQKAEPLEGAEFALYGTEKTDSEDILQIEDTTYYLQGTQVTGKDGKAVFSDLSYGVYYIVETNAPDGYVRIASPRRVELKEEDAGKGVFKITVVNTLKLEIPDMGGSGWKNHLTAILLISVGMTVLFTTNKRRRENG